jgi:hypothetical protein
VRRAPVVLLQPRTRLACVKHAASVRSEPGSNSRLKPVAWAKKMLRFSSEPAYPSKLLSLEFTQSIRARKLGWFRTDSGTSYRLSKSEPPCPAERHFYSPRSMPIPLPFVNTALTFSTAFLKVCKSPLSDNIWLADAHLRQLNGSLLSTGGGFLMKTMLLAALVLFCWSAALAQVPSPDVKFIADTLVIQAEGQYEADPDLATLTFSERRKTLPLACLP